MPTQLERTEALAAHLLDEFLSLRQRYALLEPMLYDRDVISRRGAGKQARGFAALKHSLFLSCVQEIAKLATDRDSRAPSVVNIVVQLAESSLLGTLRTRYSEWVVPSIEDEDDPLIVEALRRIELREQAERLTQFEDHVRELLALESALAASPAITAFRTVRDKLTAHTEVRFVADKYQLVDIATLGVKWGDIKTTLAELQRAVELIGFVVRNAGFAWDALETQLEGTAHGFWSPAAGT